MTELSRREFLQTSGIAAGVFVGIQLPVKGRKALAKEVTGFSHHYLVFGSENGEYIFTMDKADMGQGVITGQLTMFCEELGVDPSSVKVVAAPVEAIYGTNGGMMITGGSTSTPDRWEVLRKAGANIRQSLLQAAARQWGVKTADLKVEDGVISNASGDKSISYNQIARTTEFKEDENVKLKDPKDFKYIGKHVQKVDSHDKATGKASYGIDFQMEGLLTAVILRPPAFGAKLKSFDGAEALKLPGVKHVIEVEAGVAIVGEKYWQVQKARSMVKTEWDLGDNKTLSSESIQEDYKKLLRESRGSKAHSEGDTEAAFEQNKDGKVLEAEYELPYLAHSTMEPMNASAYVQKDRVDIWTGTQGPTFVRNEVADYLNVSRDKVFVNNMKYLGGGFGRRSTVEYPLEAVQISKALKKPVKVIWSREDDTQFSPMRPINRHKLKALLKDGVPEAWEHHIGCESIMQQFVPGILPHMLPGWVPEFLRKSAAGLADGAMDMMNVHSATAEGSVQDYAIPNYYVGISSLDIDIPIHFWRSVGHSYNGFVYESFMDELAVAAGKDPYAYRKQLLKDSPRALGVLNKVAKMAAWDTELEEGLHRGIAFHFSFSSYVAEVAEVRVAKNDIKVEKVYCAVDCGVAVNPNVVKEQMQSGIIYGLSAALNGEITLKEGAVAQTNFHDYPVLRMNQAPEIDVEIIASNESPTGVGEPGLPPVAAAVGNAIYQATGQRLRKLPFQLT